MKSLACGTLFCVDIFKKVTKKRKEFTKLICMIKEGKSINKNKDLSKKKCLL